jgi:beta-phosphoglucomutase-like phosphatase (HAD superfamily)
VVTRTPVARLSAVVFDTDGVVTRTATVHAAAWKEMFDNVLLEHATTAGQPFVAFEDDDYRRYVDGRARFDGVEAFLASRSISLPRGEPGDPPERETVCGLGNRKNVQFLATVRERGVQPFESTLRLVRRLRQLRIPTAVVSASENCAAILAAAGAAALFDVRVDGIDAADHR